MPLVLGVQGIPKVEVELLRIIVRLSSNLRSLWTVSESQPCDVLLVNSGNLIDSPPAASSSFVVVPVVARSGANAAAPTARRTLARPIFAEELVDLLNEIAPGVSRGRAAAAEVLRSVRDRASLIRWPTQATLQQNPAYIRLAAALSKSAQSAESLSTLGRLDVEACTTFLGLLEKEGALAWSGSAPPAPVRATAAQASNHKTGLLSRIRRRLGLA